MEPNSRQAWTAEVVPRRLRLVLPPTSVISRGKEPASPTTRSVETPMSTRARVAADSPMTPLVSSRTSGAEADSGAAADSDSDSDEALMLRCVAQDPEAFVHLVARYQDRVRRFCFALLRDTALADEAAQEVFLKLWESRARYRSNDRFLPLLFTMARNHCISVLRRRRLRRFVGLDDLNTLSNSGYAKASCAASNSEAARAAAAAVGVGVDNDLATRQLHVLVREAIVRLPERFRTPLVLRFVEDMPYDAIAKIIGRTPSAARSRVHYGLKALARLLPPEVAPWNE